MSDVCAGSDELWDIEQQIEQTQHMARIWQCHADKARGTESGDLIRSVAEGYRLQLEALIEARALQASTDRA